MSKRAPKHFFSNLPSVNASRTMFDMSKTDTCTINTDYYYPNYKLLVCPGDTVSLDYSSFVRLLDPLSVPMMDNLYCDVDFWYVAFDNVWEYTKLFFGEKRRPSDPDITTLPVIKFTSETLPQVGSVYDYFRIPIQGTDNLLTGGFEINALPLMSYYLIHDEWIRDEQRQDYLLDTPDFTATEFTADKFKLYKRGKRFDYATSTLLEPQLGTPTTISVGDSAVVYGDGSGLLFQNSAIDSSWATRGENGIVLLNNSAYDKFYFPTASTGDTNVNIYGRNLMTGANAGQFASMIGEIGSQHPSVSGSHILGVPEKDMIKALNSGLTNNDQVYTGWTTGLVADLTDASTVSVETLRRAFQVQAFNELCARYGNRYTEYLYSMYGVINPDQELQRPEFLGRSHFRLSVQPVVQQSASQSNSPLGNIGAIVSGGTSDSVFTKSFTKFGYIIGCINIYADLTYFQGLEKDWSISDRMDFPLSVFANLTDQPVYKRELVLTGTETDDDVFGYQEIYAWAKYAQNTMAGIVRPNSPQSIGQWSLAEKFESVPVNDATFIEMNTPLDRITSTDSSQFIQHFIVNQKFDVKVTRELPMHSDPMKWMFRF